MMRQRYLRQAASMRRLSKPAQSKVLLCASLQLQTFQNTGRAHARTDTHGHHTVFTAGLFQAIQHGGRANRTSRTQWVTQSNRTAPRIDFRRIQVQITHHGQCLRCECFVQLDPVHVVQRQTSDFQCRRNGFFRTDTHDFRINTAHGERYETTDWRQVVLFQETLGDQDQCRRAVRHL